MASTEQNVGEPVPINKDYTDVIRSDVEVDKKYVIDPGLPTKIVYYCQDCSKEVTPKRVGKKFRFRCAECKGKLVSFGTEKSIENYYSRKK